MRPALLLSLCACLSGCHALRPQLPSLIVEAWYEESGGALGPAGAKRQRSLALGVGLRLTPAPPPAATFARFTPAANPRPAAPCLSRAICAWETRTRTKALLRLEARP